MKVVILNPSLSNNILTHDIIRKVTKPKDVLLCPIELGRMATTIISPHCMTKSECLYIQIKKYQIKTSHIGVTKHNTCNY
jgi:hypothetical protein